MSERILVTGGAGYIGSHACLCLLEAGYQVVVVDNLDNSSAESLRRVEQLAGKPVEFAHLDLRNRPGLRKLFKSAGPFSAVMHFAGLKAVGESVENPLLYFQNNLQGSLVLFETMRDNDCCNLVFSSSATVYGNPTRVPVKEDAGLGATNPYGRSKLVIEQMLGDLQQSDWRWRVILLRYFNPVGAHPSGRIGEDPVGKPNNLLPFIAQVAVGSRPCLDIFGNDYPTPDGTGIRDYIHVMDLVEGHLRALEALGRQDLPGVMALNLGTGRGYSVLEVVAAFERASGRKIKYRMASRRPGDAAVCYADPGLAARELGWRARRGLDQMCADTWRWQRQNPRGYGSSG